MMVEQATFKRNTARLISQDVTYISAPLVPQARAPGGQTLRAPSVNAAADAAHTSTGDCTRPQGTWLSALSAACSLR